MKLGPFFASLIVFLFSVALFPELYAACQNVSGTGAIHQFLQWFPLIFVACLAVLPTYFGLAKEQRT